MDCAQTRKHHLIRLAALGAIAFAAVSGGCGEFLSNQLASLGGGQVGERGNVRVLFINNTAFRAVFTYGTYDQFDAGTEPDFAQFSLELGGRELAGGERSSLFESDPGSTLSCGRVFAVGSRRLIDLIEASDSAATVLEDALAEGVAFYDETDGDADPVRQGVAAPLEALLGLDFPCGALLIVRLESDPVEPGAFRVTFELIPSASTR